MDNDPQGSRDRRLRGLRSRSIATSPIERLENLRQAWRLIWDLENYGPAGLIHLTALSYVTSAPIRIWRSNHELMQIIGEDQSSDPIDVEFHTTEEEITGHWTFRGRGQPKDVHHDLNNCLFSVIAEQTGINASQLRQETIQQLKRNVRLLADYMKEIQWLEKNNRIVLLIGGASYTGATPEDAGKILDDSENNQCYNFNNPGHPRKHATGTNPDCFDCAQSYPGWKSAFLSKEDQNLAAHNALSSPAAQEAMKRLNATSNSEAVYLYPKDLSDEVLALLGRHYNGDKITSDKKEIACLVIVLRHHKNQENNPDAPVFVQTFYPKLK